jgi:alpha-tubulin suppressor-like RCC1 family protein
LAPWLWWLTCAGALAACSAAPAGGPREPPVIVSITISTSETLAWNTTVAPTANVVVQGGASSAVVWSVSDTSRATVNATTGELTLKRLGTFTLQATSTVNPSVSDVVTVRVRTQPRVAAGLAHSVALDHDGNLYSWVLSTSRLDGALGRADNDGTENRAGRVTNISPSDVRFVHVDAGNLMSVALSDEGVLYSWGRDVQGFELGRDTASAGKDNNLRPVAGFPDGVRVVDAAVGSTHGVALGDDGRVYTWGYFLAASTTQLVLGRPFSVTDAPGVGVVSGVDGLAGRVVKVDAGSSHSALVMDDGRIFTWGTDAYGKLGRAISPIPAGEAGEITVFSNTDLRLLDVRLGEAETYVLADDGAWYSFGWNNRGQLGRNNALTSDSRPGLVGAPVPPAAFTCVAAYDDFAFGLTGDGSVYSWGWGPNLGRDYGFNAIVTQPGLVTFTPSDAVIVDVSAGGAHALALTSDGAVYSWGIDDDSFGAEQDGGRLGRPPGVNTPNNRPGLVLDVNGNPLNLRPASP